MRTEALRRLARFKTGVVALLDSAALLPLLLKRPRLSQQRRGALPGGRHGGRHAVEQEHHDDTEARDPSRDEELAVATTRSCSARSPSSSCSGTS